MIDNLLFGRGIRGDGLVRKFPEDIRYMVNWRGQKAHDSFKRRMLASARMASRWDKCLGSSETLCQRLRLSSLGLQSRFKCGKILLLFFFNVLGKNRPQFLELWNVARVVSIHVLEVLEKLFDLEV
jgi:hypothetical protein